MSASFMTLTPAAAKRVNKLLQPLANQVLRIGVEKSGCSGWKYTVETSPEPAPNDFVMTDQGVTVYVDQQAIKFLQGTTLDCIEKEMGLWQWKFHNPQVDNYCGCGESFNLKD